MLLAGLAAPAPAEAGTRAVLTWDTDDTDVDLHVWDEYGNHAWYGDQQGISGGELSTDIVYGFGPEEFFEYENEGRPLTFGVCYYASNRDDGVVPETIATVDITDPDGSTRTMRRRLRAATEGFLLGSSPAGSSDAHVPDPGWCRGNPDVHGPEDDGGLGEADSSQSFEGCDRTRRRIGVVDVCADTVSGDGPRYTLSGNVRLNGSVAFGAPVVVDTAANTIESAGAGTIGLVRGGATIPVAAGDLSIDPRGVRDEVSGRGNLAAAELSAPRLERLSIAGLPVSLSTASDGDLNLYVDRADGGGLLLSSRVELPLGAGFASVDAVTVGAHGRSAAAVRLLGGTVRFGNIPIGATGWRFSGLELSYSEADDRWSARGGFATPVFGLDVDGSIVGGRLNSLGVAVHRDVPLGTTGFILSSAGGFVDGLAQPPLKLGLTASGRWGSVPGLRGVAIIYIRDVKLELDLSGRLSLSGRVEFLRPDNSLVKGRISLSAGIAPFNANGSLAAEAKVGPIDVTADASLKINSSHFTAAGGARGSLRGLRLASGRGVLSDKGIGASGEVCIGAFGRCATRVTLGGGMEWSRFPHVEWIGGDVNRYATISQRRRTYTVDVERGRPLLFVDAVGTTGLPSFEVRSPSGTTYTTRRRRADSAIVEDPATNFTGLTVLRPEPGRWVVRDLEGGGSTQVVTQTIRRTRRVRLAAVRPSTSRRNRLARRQRSITARWTSAGLPRTTTVAVYVTADRRELGELVGRAGRRARGSVRIPRRMFAPGANYVRLVVSHRGVAADEVLSRPVWAR